MYFLSALAILGVTYAKGGFSLGKSDDDGGGTGISRRACILLKYLGLAMGFSVHRFHAVLHLHSHLLPLLVPHGLLGQ